MVLMDIQMPGIGGFEVVQQLRACGGEPRSPQGGHGQRRLPGEQAAQQAGRMFVAGMLPGDDQQVDPPEAADRGQRRGAIRAKIMDWIELGPHASRIAAVRPAHRRHGGAGAFTGFWRRCLVALVSALPLYARP